MTKEEWRAVENELSFEFGNVLLDVDGYHVTVICEPYKPMHCHLVVYIGGIFQGKWLIEDNEESTEIRRRFCKEHKKCILTANDKKQLKQKSKAFQKKVADSCTISYHMPYFTSFRTLKSHLIKNNTSIELVRIRSSDIKPGYERWVETNGAEKDGGE